MAVLSTCVVARGVLSRSHGQLAPGTWDWFSTWTNTNVMVVMSMNMPWVETGLGRHTTLVKWQKQSLNLFIPRSSITMYLLMISSAFATKQLKKSEWINDPEAVESVKKEAIGLRNNQTWDDSSVTTLANLKLQAKISGNKVKIANLLTLCGVKHAEQDISLQKYKGRIVYRGDDIRDQDGCQVVFDPLETSTNPTALVALNITTARHLQMPFKLSSGRHCLRETWVVLGEELWLPEWFEIYPKGTRLCVRLLKSLYGHPLAGKLWQSYLDQRLAAMNAVELEGFPSNYFIQVGSKMLLLNIYVDDLTLSGDSTLHQTFWEEMRKHINIEPESVYRKMRVTNSR